MTDKVALQYTQVGAIQVTGKVALQYTQVGAIK